MPTATDKFMERDRERETERDRDRESDITQTQAYLQSDHQRTDRGVVSREHK